MKFDLLNAIAKGVINMGKLGDSENQYLLLITTTTKTFAIPCIKSKAGNYAYIDPEVPTEDYTAISLVIDEINAKNIYKGIPKFKPLCKRAPDHSDEVTDILQYSISGAAGTQTVPDNLDSILSAMGYKQSEKKLAKASGKRDYSVLLSDPKVKNMFDDDEAAIKAVGATYEQLADEVKVAYEAVENGGSIGILFTGRAGTGKSFATRILANHGKAPLLNIQITDGTAVEDLIGMYVPRTTASEGGASYEFVAGPLLKAYTEGYQVVIEEVNYGQPGVIAKLNDMTDFTPRFPYCGKVYHRHPNFAVYMTMNPGYAGTEILNMALKNRFQIVQVPAFDKEKFTDLAVAYSASLGHPLRREFFKQLFDFANLIEKEAGTSKWNESVVFSIRNAQRLCENILHKSRSFDEFRAAIAVQYLNYLSVDNDNSDKLDIFKNSEEIKEQIRKIYEYYDFREIAKKKVTADFDSLFEDDAPAEGSGDAASKATIDDLLSRFEV